MSHNPKKTAQINALLQYLRSGGLLPRHPFLSSNLKNVQKFNVDQLSEHHFIQQLEKLVAYMHFYKWITPSPNNSHWQITVAGLARLAKRNLHNSMDTPSYWDQRWRVVIFDIPVSHGTHRRAFTYKLKQLGFYPLQRSVWVHPFPASKVIQQLCEVYGIEKFVTYLETNQITRANELREQFHHLLQKVPTRSRSYL